MFQPAADFLMFVLENSVGSSGEETYLFGNVQFFERVKCFSCCYDE